MDDLPFLFRIREVRGYGQVMGSRGGAAKMAVPVAPQSTLPRPPVGNGGPRPSTLPGLATSWLSPPWEL